MGEADVTLPGLVRRSSASAPSDAPRASAQILVIARRTRALKRSRSAAVATFMW